MKLLKVSNFILALLRAAIDNRNRESYQSLKPMNKYSFT